MKYTVSLLSYNVFGAPFHGQKILRTLLKTKVRKRFRLIAREIYKMNLDILLFQEVHTYPHLFVLKKALPKEYKIFYQLGIYGPKGGLVTFSKLPIHKKSFIDFFDRGVYWNKSITGPLTQKGILMTKIKDRDLWILNTHMTQNSSGVWDGKSSYTNLLISQLNQCSTLISSLHKKGYRIVIGGDFNMPDNSELYEKFLNSADLFDVYDNNKGSTYLQWFEGEIHSGRIDYIFAQKLSNIKVLQSKYVFTEPLMNEAGEEQLLSDHVGLEAKFELS